MVSGLQEILIILIILLGLFFIPRMMNNRKAPPAVVFRRKPSRLSWAYRLAIVLSVLWPLACTAYFRPWQDDAVSFAVVGLGPVIVGWSVHWVMAGKGKK